VKFRTNPRFSRVKATAFSVVTTNDLQQSRFAMQTVLQHLLGISGAFLASPAMKGGMSDSIQLICF
jgi:hypothetical protein